MNIFTPIIFCVFLMPTILFSSHTAVPPISLQQIQAQFNVDLKVAAKNLGVCESAFKKYNRHYGIKRWPGRIFISLDKLIGTAESQEEREMLLKKRGELFLNPNLKYTDLLSKSALNMLNERHNKNKEKNNTITPLNKTKNKRKNYLKIKDKNLTFNPLFANLPFNKNTTKSTVEKIEIDLTREDSATEMEDPTINNKNDATNTSLDDIDDTGMEIDLTSEDSTTEIEDPTVNNTNDTTNTLFDDIDDNTSEEYSNMNENDVIEFHKHKENSRYLINYKRLFDSLE